MSKTFKNFRGEENREKYFRSERVASKNKKHLSEPYYYDSEMDDYVEVAHPKETNADED